MTAPTGIAVADSHNDLLMAVRYQRERGHSDPFGDFWLPQLQAGGVRLQVLPVCTEEQYVGEGALRRCLQLMAEARHFADVHADSVAIAESGSEITEIIGSGRIALVLAIEGAEPVGSHLEVLDALWRAGVRMCSLTWNRRTMMADGIAERDTGGRLTKLGVEAVRFMQSLGMVVDVSHLSEAGFYQLAEVADRPFIASHSSCRALVDHPRNLTDQQLAVMAASGSLVGINAFGPFLAEEDPSYRSYADHVEHALAVLGPNLVGFGADFIDDVAEVVDPVFTGLLVDQTAIPITRGLQRPADFPQVVAELQSRLGDEQARRVAGQNLIDFLTRQLSPQSL
jgi:membrane dipeptidase